MKEDTESRKVTKRGRKRQHDHEWQTQSLGTMLQVNPSWQVVTDIEITDDSPVGIMAKVAKPGIPITDRGDLNYRYSSIFRDAVGGKVDFQSILQGLQ